MSAGWRVLRGLALVVFAAVVAGCVTRRTIAAKPDSVAPPPPTVVAPPLEPGAEAAAPAEVAAEPPPDPHPIVLALARRSGAWAPEIEADVAQLQLDGTGFAETEATLAYLRYRLLQGVLLPALKPSYDQTVREYREALERAALFDESYPLASLQMGPEQPAACAPCVAAGTTCSALCERERRRLRPATLAAGRLDRQLAFSGQPRGGDAGSPGAESIPLEDFLDAAVEAGVARSLVEGALASIVTDLVRRCRGLEGPLPADTASGLPAYETLLLGYRRWEATYAHDREPVAIGADPIVVDLAGHLDAFNRFEQAILRRAPMLRQHAVALRRYREQLIAVERGTATSNPEDERPAMDCTVLRPDDARRCAEVIVGLHALDLQVSEAVLAGDRLVAPELGVAVGLALEHLSLGAVETRTIDAAFAQLLSDLAQRGSSRVEL